MNEMQQMAKLISETHNCILGDFWIEARKYSTDNTETTLRLVWNLVCYSGLILLSNKDAFSNLPHFVIELIKNHCGDGTAGECGRVLKLYKWQSPIVQVLFLTQWIINDI